MVFNKGNELLLKIQPMLGVIDEKPELPQSSSVVPVSKSLKITKRAGKTDT